jgi:hypothetical protein
MRAQSDKEDINNKKETDLCGGEGKGRGKIRQKIRSDESSNLNDKKEISTKTPLEEEKQNLFLMLPRHPN